MSVANPPQKRLTVEEYIAFTERPENAHKRFELIYGEIVEVGSNGKSSKIGILIAHFLVSFLLKNDDIEGSVTGEAGTFEVGENIFIPDVAYMKEEPDGDGFMKFAPVLAVEVVSNSRNNQELRALIRKTHLYARLGIVLWIVDWQAQTVEVFDPAEEGSTLYEAADTLVAGDYLPGFTMKLGDIFPSDRKPTETVAVDDE